MPVDNGHELPYRNHGFFRKPENDKSTDRIVLNLPKDSGLPRHILCGFELVFS